jgi:RNA polymerase sporulation-specific sigma factor
MIKEVSVLVGYLKNGAYPLPLSREEEDYYVNELSNGNKDLGRNKLIEHNLRLVVHIAKKYEGCGENQDDLFSIGTIGLIKAVDSFSNDKGVKIATYAAKCIENEILMHLRANKRNFQVASLSDSIGTDKEGDEITLMDVIADSSDSITDQLNHRDSLSILACNLDVLDAKEKEIIDLRYGINGVELTQKEVAKKFNISRSYVSRIEKRALIKLLNQIKKQDND